MLFSTRDGLAGSQQQLSMDGGWDIAVSAASSFVRGGLIAKRQLIICLHWLTWLADPQK